MRSPLGSHIEPFGWIVVLISGLIGLVLMLGLFELAMICLSSLLGAHLIVYSIHALASVELIVFIVLSIMGILFQSKSRHR